MEELVLRQLQQLPANLQQEVLDFIGYLLSKQQTVAKQHTTPASRSKEIEEAIRIVRMGCDMHNFGDALAYQTASRAERTLPFRD
jgi:Protein of unknown function (DUF2281)